MVGLLAACAGPQSALDPGGVEAARVATLFWVMVAGAALIWVAVIGLAIYVTRVSPGARREESGMRLIVWGGTVFPTLVLAALLTYGLTMLAELRAPAEGLRIAVSGERFWWRVRYGVGNESAGAAAVESANELRLPAGVRTELVLESPDVIHSLWIPSLAGKVDMIPGRSNRMVVEPTRPGRYRGVCAEFCGTAHGLMALDVVVMVPEDFERWLAGQAESVSQAGDHPGRGHFLANGCGACHQVRGTEAEGQVGPDLTHVGGRASIGAGLWPTTVESLVRFISETDRAKPGVQMPAFGMLPEGDVRAIAEWLESLK
jgi:cytochrome c oxidase subunit 2